MFPVRSIVLPLPLAGRHDSAQAQLGPIELRILALLLGEVASLSVRIRAGDRRVVERYREEDLPCCRDRKSIFFN